MNIPKPPVDEPVAKEWSVDVNVDGYIATIDVYADHEDEAMERAEQEANRTFGSTSAEAEAASPRWMQ